MHRNYCFRRKQYSYLACDAILAASISISMKWKIFFTSILKGQYLARSLLYRENYSRFYVLIFRLLDNRNLLELRPKGRIMGR